MNMSDSDNMSMSSMSNGSMGNGSMTNSTIQPMPAMNMINIFTITWDCDCSFIFYKYEIYLKYQN